MKIEIISLICALLFCACGSQEEKKSTNIVAVEIVESEKDCQQEVSIVNDTVIEDLAEEEDAPECMITHIKHSKKSKKDFTSVSDTAYNFYFSSDTELQNNDKNIYWLMNRMMQTSVNVNISDDAWIWMNVVSDYISKYSVKKQRKGDKYDNIYKAINDIDTFIYVYSEGGQPEMNTYTYIEYIMELYCTLIQYERLISSINDAELKKLIYDEFASWYNANECFYEYKSLNEEGGYSSFAMDNNMSRTRMFVKRYDYLIFEGEIIRSNIRYKGNNHDVSINMLDDLIKEKGGEIPEDILKNNMIKNDTDYTLRSEYMCQECDDTPCSKCVCLNYLKSVELWYKIRMKILNKLPKSRKDAYMRITEDIMFELLMDAPTYI